MITLSSISHHTAGTTILSEITASIPKGGITALIGPNGAGKSSLLNLIARQWPLQSGQIEIDGVGLHDMAQNQLALRLALVAQHVGVASRLRVRDLVSFGRWPHCNGRLRAEDHEAVERALDVFDLQSVASRFLDQLSGGQRQRAFIAMALAQDTDWVLLDEPLNNLDMFHARELMRTLHELTHAQKKSVVMVIHEVNYASHWADHVIGLKSGRVVLEGTPSDVLSTAKIQALFGVEAEISDTLSGKLVNHYS